MRDPVKAFDTIKENYIRYIETAFRTKFESVEKERRDLLNTDKVLYREPWVEPLPDYKSSGKTIDQLTSEEVVNLNESELKLFQGLVKTGLFPENGVLHLHQARMLQKATSGKHCIITSGTGSGKTESFLLPLFAQLAKELATWKTTIGRNNTPWWQEGHTADAQVVDVRDYTLAAGCQQRMNDERPAGVRALLLYPMNALVEDQLTRLRKALDSDDTRRWYNENAKNNCIYFGRYNSTTPVSGELFSYDDSGKRRINGYKIKQLKKELRTLDLDADKVAQYIAETPDLTETPKDLTAFFPRMDGSEMRCRFDMQVTPPDVLITNYSMLSIMLMRDVDNNIFEETRKWLSCEDVYSTDLSPEQKEAEKKNRIFNLVIDELHLYRGTQGTEVAYLLRLVLGRLGLHPDHPQLRILASSASLEPGDPQSLTFVEDFFGVSNASSSFEIIEGESNSVDVMASNVATLPIKPWVDLRVAYEKSGDDITKEAFISQCKETARGLAAFAGIKTTAEDPVEYMLRVMLDPKLQLRERLYHACKVNGKERAICSLRANGDDSDGNKLSEMLFGATEPKEELRKALSGLLIARSLFDESVFKKLEDELKERKLPRFRFHYFFRNIEGLWASVNSTDLLPRYQDEERTAGTIYSQAQIKSNVGHRVLELLYCDNCGTTLFGGSRLKIDDYTFELLPLSPNIEGIPEKTPHKLLERRTYQEYAVFWPEGKQTPVPHERPNGYWRQPVINTSLFDQKDFSAFWKPASLNIFSGDIQANHTKADEQPGNWIKGYYFQIERDSAPQMDIALQEGEDTHKATPSVCPACGVNHQKWNNNSPKQKTSPIRGFRTGFAKSSQMFAKELLYQLPGKPGEQKLVVFSDSREDAAQVANGIERNHFTDLLRELLIRELNNRLIFKQEVLNAFQSNDDSIKQRMREQNAEMYDEVELVYTDAQTSSANPILQHRKTAALNKIREIQYRIVKVHDLVDETNSVNLAPLIRRLVELGVNPGGNEIKLQKALLRGERINWYQVIDFNSFEWKSGTDTTYIESIKKGTFAKLASMFFASLFYSFEASALGSVTVDPALPQIGIFAGKAGLSQSVFLEIVNSCIRILGDKYKHNQIDKEEFPLEIMAYKDLPSQCRNYIKAVSENIGIASLQIGQSVFDFLVDTQLLSANTGLQVEQLFIKAAIFTDPVWISTRGSRAHLHKSGGICTYSRSKLNASPDTTCGEIWKKNYLSYSAAIEKRRPIRLHCEELTGQTDDQFRRQRHFRNVILKDEGLARVKQIDLLSVTTTLEVGVDIGALQAVMLGNMPPQRFNYQQRVGRAGRRGQAYSVILTFCRGRSHDEFYFANPQKITGDNPPSPFLTMTQDRIYKRLLVKELLRQAYKTIGVNENFDEVKSSIHGNFGKQHNWNTYRTNLALWIQDNSAHIESIVDTLLPKQLVANRAEFIRFVSNTEDGLVAQLQGIVDNPEIPTDDISQKFAEGGALPMFGMPTDVKYLYHGISQDNSTLAIDRSQAMAIYEFAPSSQKTKDKAIYQSIGFTSEFVPVTDRGNKETITNKDSPHTGNSPFYLSRWMLRCKNCGYSQSFADSEEPMETQCEVCGNPDNSTFSKFKIKSPKAYRTNLLEGNDTRDEADLVTNRPPIYADRSTDGDRNTLEDTIKNAKVIISDKDVTWRVNTNADKFYAGSYYNVENYNPESRKTHRFQQQWILKGLANTVNPHNDYQFRVSNAVEEQPIALAINKKTEMLKIHPNSIPEELNLDMFRLFPNPTFVDRQSLGVRAGFYSAAFLLQRILADKLDIDPTEIEIADITKREIVEGGIVKNVAEIILTDELPNGSGFVRHLYDHFEEILSDSLVPQKVGSYIDKIHEQQHQDKCSDACYDCLKIYRNMNWHSLLDWRLGIGMLRVLSDSNYKSGADGNFSGYIEIKDWLLFAGKLRDQFVDSFFVSPKYPDRNEFIIEFNGIPAIRHGSRSEGRPKVILITHPFWNLDSYAEDAAYTKAIALAHQYIQGKGGSVDEDFECLDTFNIHRRIGWCYEKVVNK